VKNYCGQKPELGGLIDPLEGLKIKTHHTAWKFRRGFNSHLVCVN